MTGYVVMGGAQAAEQAEQAGDTLTIQHIDVTEWSEKNSDVNGQLTYTFAWNESLDSLVSFLKDYAPSLKYAVE